MISTRLSFIFIHIPKTAGNSIQEVLLPYSDDEKTTTSHQDGVERFGVAGQVTRRKHATLADYEQALGAKKLSAFLKFCVVRNPWERALSNYFSPHRWMERRGEDYVPLKPVWDAGKFLDLLADMKPAADYLKNAKGEVQIDRVIRFEHLASDFQDVCTALSIPATVTLQHRNRKTPDFEPQQFYHSPRLVAAVAEVMAEDIERWHYKPDGT